MTPDAKLNGFVVSFIVNTFRALIYVGWYQNNFRHGNLMKINAADMKIYYENTGYYNKGQKIGPMIEDPNTLSGPFSRSKVFKNFCPNL